MNDLYSVHNGYYLIWHSKCKRAATLFILAVTTVLVLVLEDGVWIVEFFAPSSVYRYPDNNILFGEYRQQKRMSVRATSTRSDGIL